MSDFEEQLDFLFSVSQPSRAPIQYGYEGDGSDGDDIIPTMEELQFLDEIHQQQQLYGEAQPDDFFFRSNSDEGSDWDSDIDGEFNSDSETELIPPNISQPELNQVEEEVEEEQQAVPNHNEQAQQPPYVRDRKKKMTNLERQLIVQQILNSFSNKKMEIGAINKAASDFQCSRQTVSAIWNIAKKQMESSQAINVSQRYKGNSGRKKMEIDLSRLRNIELSNRKNIRQVALALDISSTTAFRLVKRGELRSHSNAIKPYLNHEGIKKRLAFCLSKIHFNHLNENPMFEGFFNHVHIDEKWFYLTKENEHYYLLKDEPEPHRSCKSKKFITKVMFLCAVARPRFDEEGVMLFDGMIGIWPFTVIEPSKRKSKNRPRGVLETKAITSITKEVTRRTLVDKLLPAIKSKWPDGNFCTVWVQQDNARPHLATTDAEWVEHATADGWDIRLCCQPANSPDFNVLDLGFFRHLQSIQDLKCPKDTCELVNAVTEAYEHLDPHKLNKVWLSLQYCMNECIKVKGSNCYKVPHAGKDSMEREGQLPIVIEPCINEVRAASQWLNEGIILPQQYMAAQVFQSEDLETQEIDAEDMES